VVWSPDQRAFVVPAHTGTEMVPDAVDMASWSRGHVAGLVAHPDARQFTSVRYENRLDELGAVSSIR
jgi:putative transposase